MCISVVIVRYHRVYSVVTYERESVESETVNSVNQTSSRATDIQHTCDIDITSLSSPYYTPHTHSTAQHC